VWQEVERPNKSSEFSIFHQVQLPLILNMKENYLKVLYKTCSFKPVKRN
jgi:hypothetical protein